MERLEETELHIVNMTEICMF